jgi:hypothetical protein
MLVASRAVGLEVNTENTKYVVVSRHQNAGRNQNLLIANKSFGNVSKFTFLGQIVTKIEFMKKLREY